MKVDDDLKCRERPTSLENPFKINNFVHEQSDVASSSRTQYEGGTKEGNINEMEKADSDIDEIDFDNFKGIYFDDDPNRKF